MVAAYIRVPYRNKLAMLQNRGDISHLSMPPFFQPSADPTRHLVTFVNQLQPSSNSFTSIDHRCRHYSQRLFNDVFNSVATPPRSILDWFHLEQSNPQANIQCQKAPNFLSSNAKVEKTHAKGERTYLNPRAEGYSIDLVKSTTLTMFFEDVIWFFANTVVSEGKSGKYTHDAILITLLGSKFWRPCTEIRLHGHRLGKCPYSRVYERETSQTRKQGLPTWTSGHFIQFIEVSRNFFGGIHSHNYSWMIHPVHVDGA